MKCETEMRPASSPSFMNSGHRSKLKVVLALIDSDWNELPNFTTLLPSHESTFSWCCMLGWLRKRCSRDGTTTCDTITVQMHTGHWFCWSHICFRAHHGELDRWLEFTESLLLLVMMMLKLRIGYIILELCLLCNNLCRKLVSFGPKPTSF